MFGLFEAKTKAYADLGGKEFKEKFLASPGAVLLDVRTSGEFRAGTVPGAINMDMMSPTFRPEVGKLDKSKEYFLICRSGNRSGQACSYMAKEGFKVNNLAYGIGDWPF
jgi:rhodanese-related sulfurtransferase